MATSHINADSTPASTPQPQSNNPAVPTSFLKAKMIKIFNLALPLLSVQFLPQQHQLARQIAAQHRCHQMILRMH